jgi:uncharacterized membrane protein
MRIRVILWPLLLAASAASIAACKSEGGEVPACPDAGTALTYADFGQGFFEKYCVSCHAKGSGIGGAQDIPLESQAQIQANLDDIYSEAGGTNTGMPPSSSKPTAAERQQLAEWLSCGAE